ncbi:MAG: hypothetical protein NTW20_12930 [Rhodobacterales bacterium]|nr:hypothetical protein [Rhodobacterales bacterium]
MQTGTIFSGIGHAGLILWVLVGDWLFAPDPAQETMVTQVSMMTSAEFEALQAAATPTPSTEPAAVRPQARPEEVVAEPPPPEEPPPPVEDPPPPPEEPPPAEEVVPEEPPPPPPSDAVQAEAEQLLPSESVEIQPVAEAEDIVAPDPVQPETEAEVSDTPAPAVAEDPAADTVVEQDPTEATVAEDTGDVLQTEANQEQSAETGMTTSVRPRSRPEKPAVVPEPATALASAAAPPAPVDAPAEQPVDDQATDDAIAALLDEAAAEPAEDASPDTPTDTGGQDRRHRAKMESRGGLDRHDVDDDRGARQLWPGWQADGLRASGIERPDPDRDRQAVRIGAAGGEPGLCGRRTSAARRKIRHLARA